MGYENSAGLGVRTHFGPKLMYEGQKFGGVVSTSGLRTTMEWIITYNDLPALVAQGAMEKHIPAGSIIHKATIQTLVVFAGGTSYDIGLQQKDGTTIDLDGLWDLLAAASLSVESEMSDAVEHAGTNSGLLVQDVVLDAGVADSRQPLTSDGYLVMVETGTFTAGKARILIDFTLPRLDASSGSTYVAGGVQGATA